MTPGAASGGGHLCRQVGTANAPEPMRRRHGKKGLDIALGFPVSTGKPVRHRLPLAHAFFRCPFLMLCHSGAASLAPAATSPKAPPVMVLLGWARVSSVSNSGR